MVIKMMLNENENNEILDRLVVIRSELLSMRDLENRSIGVSFINDDGGDMTKRYDDSVNQIEAEITVRKLID